MTSIKKNIKYIGNIIAILSIIFVIYAVIKLDIDFSQIKNIPAFIIICIIGILLSAMTVYGMAFAWKINLQYLSGQPVKYSEGAQIYVKANIGKYMPGNVMHYVERNLFAAKIGLNQLETATSSVIEIIGQAFAAILLSIIIVYKDFINTVKKTVSAQMTFILLGVAIIGVFAIIILYHHSSKLRTIVQRILNVQFLFVILKVLIIYGIVLICQGFLLMLLCQIVLQCNLTIHQALLIIAYYMLAWVIGFVVPGAPGGIGVREMIIVMLMNGVIGEEIILVAALIHRMISILGDITAYLFSLPMTINHDHTQKQSS